MAFWKRKTDTKKFDFGINLEAIFKLPPKQYINSVQDIIQAEKYNPLISAISNTKANLFAKADFVVKRNNEVIENTVIEKILKAPNYMQSENNFLASVGKSLFLTGHAFIFIDRKNRNGLLQEGDRLWCLDTEKVKIEFSDRIFFRSQSLYNYIDYFEYKDQAKVIQFRPDEIIWLTNTMKNEYVFLYSSIETPLNTYSAAYQIINTLYRKKGGFGIFSNAATSGDALFNAEISEEEIKRLQERLKDYSFDPEDYNFIITNSRLDYKPITFPLSEMQLESSMKRAIVDICNIMGYEPILILGAEGTTYANLEQASKRVYTEYIIPAWQLLETELNNRNLTIDTIEIDYSNIEQLQKDEMKKEELLQKKTQRYLQLLEKGVITIDEMKKIFKDLENVYYI